MLTHSQARSIAEARWGRGGTHSIGTNRPGAFYFICSGHGGFVIDARCLSDDELVALSPYIDLEDATLYHWGRRRILSHPYRERGRKVPFAATTEKFKFFLLEEDCDWALAYLFTGIRRKDKPSIPEAQETFDRWIKNRVAA